jgi:uncharacterized membrane protein YebE (DUF533 family)
MFDPERLLGQMLGDALGGRRGRSALRTGSLGGKDQIGIGLLGIAMAAWEHHQQKGPTPRAPSGLETQAMVPPPPPPPSVSPPPPPTPNVAATRAMPLLDERQQSLVLLIRAMIAAANADGRIDATERAGILGRARDGGLDTAALEFLDAELAKPQSLQQVLANTPPALASDTYAAAVLSIQVDTEAERRWLDQLAAGLALDAAQRSDVDARIAQSLT